MKSKELEDTGGVSSEDEFDERKHAKLLDSITSLDGKNRSRHTQRTLVSSDVSEFNFSRGGKNSKIELSQLVGSLSKDSFSHGILQKQLGTAQKRKSVVSTPLPRHKKEKIDRSIAYQKTSNELRKWYPVVEKNREAEQLIFPSQQPDVKLVRTEQFSQKFQPRTPLEMEVAALLQGSKSVHSKKKELTPAETRALKAMSLEEAKKRHAELRKYRALMSYKEAKASWQKRIKSKRYHRVLRKERMKKDKKSLEDLQKSAPERYLEKLKQMDDKRIQERMSLKHRGGSKYSKKQMIYAKYDSRSRQAIEDMVQKSKELRQKHVVESDSNSDEDVGGLEEESATTRVIISGDNPWMSSSTGSKIRERQMAGGSENAEDEQVVSEYSRPEAVANQIDCYKIEDQSSLTVPDINSQILTETSNMVDKLSDDFIDNEEKDEERSNELGEKKHKKLKQKEKVVKKKQTKVKKTKDVGEKGEVPNQIDCNKTNDQDIPMSSIKSEVSTEKVGVQTSNMEDDMSASIVNDEKDIDEIFTEIEKRKHPKKLKRKKKKKVVGKKQITEKVEEAAKKGEKKETPLIDEKLERKSTLEEIEAEYSESDVDDDTEETQKSSKAEKTAKKEAEIFVDPKKLFSKDSVINRSEMPTSVQAADDDDQTMTIAEAFADDDVIDEFMRDKKNIIEQEKPKAIDLTLPGWGSWGGAGTSIPKRKQKRFLIRAPPTQPRKDINLGNVIINEQKDSAIAKHQVSDLPFPYTSVEQFEQSIRTPIGKTWVPETAYKQLVKPKVVTRLGHIIQPIDKSEVFSKHKSGKRKPDMSFSGNKNNKEKKGGKKAINKSEVFSKQKINKKRT